MNEEFKAKIIFWLKFNASQAALSVDPFVSAEDIADDIEAQLYGRLYRFPPNMPLQAQEQVRSEIRELVTAEIRRHRKANDLDFEEDLDT